MNNTTVTTSSTTQDRDPKEPPNQSVEEALRLIDDLKFFLATAPANWQENQIIRRYYLNHDEGFVSCVFWNNLYFVTGTDIVKCLIYRFEQFGRTITDRKKFEEGVFSDLRNLKCGTDAILEPPKSKFLEFLYKNSCLRTQKKQKVFFWFSVQHDKLFADALERDLKRELIDQKTTTRADREPALSFKYDDSKSLFEQLTSHIDEKKKLLGVFSGPGIGAAGGNAGGNGVGGATGGVTGGVPNGGLLSGPNNAAGANPGPLAHHPLEESAFGYGVPPNAHGAGGGGGGGNAQFADYNGTEDDFPLDFFPPNDYINETVDPARALTANTVPLFDPSIFLNPVPGAGIDDFLIDHASPFSPDLKKEDGIEDGKDDKEVDHFPEFAPSANPLLAPGAAAAAYYNPQLGQPEYMVNPYVVDPLYYDHVAVLQAQQQMMEMMNPMAAGYPAMRRAAGPSQAASRMSKLRQQSKVTKPEKEVKKES